MVMIRCPSCGKSVLDVASACPHCGHVLMQNPLEARPGGPLHECRRCGKHIDRAATVCPYCGHHLRRAQIARRVAWSVLGVAAVVVAVAIVLRSGIIRLPHPTPQAAQPAPASATPESAPSRPVAAAPRVVPEPAPAESARVAAPPPVPPTVITPAPGGLRQTRWTTDWANVREERSVEARVVRVLSPGVRIQVADQRAGWWEVYLDGSRVGFIANSLLAREPPGE
jgi:predicted RNA-binding Zn-ribbon protein involved in translation (DUF1610 family)